MKSIFNKNISTKKQYTIGVSFIVLASVTSYISHDYIGYRAVALILLLAVSLSAMLFEILPVLVCAILSALILNFFFIPPLYTFKIESAEDVLMFLMYILIAMINAVLTIKIRQFEKKKRDEEEKEKTIALYNTLLNSLSHELRTPISTIIGAVDTIVDNEERLSKENIRELYTEIGSAGNRLNQQVENLLNMSRLDAGMLKPTFDWFDVNELVFKAIKESTHQKEEQRVVFEPNDNISLLYIDGGFLEMILYNLIHNAIQHTTKKSNILINCDYVNEKLIIDISDNGLGFPNEEIDFVFDKFYKLSGTATGGTGLGLSIVKGFTEALNGKISLENKKTGGAHFHLEIPSIASTIQITEDE
jgi:two-component system sensor histidine kinase KdpD